MEENRKPKKRFKCDTCSSTFSRKYSKYHGDFIEDSSMDQTNLPDVNESQLDPSDNTEPSTATTEPSTANTEPSTATTDPSTATGPIHAKSTNVVCRHLSDFIKNWTVDQQCS